MNFWNFTCSILVCLGYKFHVLLWPSIHLNIYASTWVHRTHIYLDLGHFLFTLQTHFLHFLSFVLFCFSDLFDFFSSQCKFFCNNYWSISSIFISFLLNRTVDLATHHYTSLLCTKTFSCLHFYLRNVFIKLISRPKLLENWPPISWQHR